MAATSPSLDTRHSGAIHICQASRIARVRLSGISGFKGDTVHLSWMYSYEVSAMTDWKEVDGSSGRRRLEQDGVSDLDFLLTFGPVSPDAPSPAPEGHCQLVLTRPSAELLERLPSDGPVLPTLFYVATNDEADILAQGIVPLTSSWADVCFREASRLCGSASEVIPTKRVEAMLRQRWQDLFGLEGAPKLSQQMIEKIVLVGCDRSIRDSYPRVVSRKAFCGDKSRGQADKAISIWTVFQGLAELVGRSMLIRKLFGAGQINLLSKDETVQIHTDMLAELGLPYVFFFRLPRSAISEAAIVIELFEVTGETSLKAVRPTPYVTMSQIARADGNVLKAFANLDSSHSAILKGLTYKALLQPPQIQLRGDINSHGIGPLSAAEVGGSDDKWWSSMTKLSL